MDGKMLARFGAIAFVAAAITATVVEVTRKEERPEATPARPVQANSENTLQSELFRCQSLGEAGPRDPACLSAWAESRRRFLTPGTANAAAGRERTKAREAAPVGGSSASGRPPETAPPIGDGE